MGESHVTEDQQRAAYDALGLDPELYNRTASVLIEPWQTTVVRYRKDEHGSSYLLADGEPAVDVVVLPLATKETTDHV